MKLMVILFSILICPFVFANDVIVQGNIRNACELTVEPKVELGTLTRGSPWRQITKTYLKVDCLLDVPYQVFFTSDSLYTGYTDIIDLNIGQNQGRLQLKEGGVIVKLDGTRGTCANKKLCIIDVFGYMGDSAKLGNFSTSVKVELILD